MSVKPRCVIVTGQGGSGKTTLSKALGEALSMPVLSRDEIKEGYVNTFGISHDDLPPDTNGVVSRFFFETVHSYLSANVSVVIEAAFQHKVWAPNITTISDASHPFLIICDIDAELAERRHLQRGLDDPRRPFYHGDPTVAEYRRTGVMLPPREYDPPSLDIPTVRVSTEADYDPSIEELVNLVRSEDIRGGETA